jgi:RNA polymerase sigma-70 factor (ECF subfamily)
MRSDVHDLAFDGWFRARYPVIVDQLARLLGDRPAAEDVAAEAFARALVRWPRLSEAGYQDAWVTRVAVNIGLDILRRRPPEIAFGEGALTDSELVELRLVVRQALRSLPKRQREAVALRYLMGLDPQEVARTLDVSLNTAKTHLRRGVARLRSDPNLSSQPEGLDVLTAD